MITLRNASFGYRKGAEILRDTSVALPSDRRVALLAGKADGKSTVIKLLAGALTPTSGRIERSARVSFPAGYQAGFRLTHSARQNAMFAAQLYGADPREVFEFLQRVSGLGEALEIPLRHVSLQNRTAIAYIVTYAIPFQTYLFDNVIGPIVSEIPDFYNTCIEMFNSRIRESGIIIATSNTYFADNYCDCAAVLHKKKLYFFDNVYDGIHYFEREVLPFEEELAADRIRQNRQPAAEPQDG